MKYPLLLLALAACGPRPGPAEPDDPPPPPPEQKPIGPGPKVSWIRDHFETADLPAISKDGTKFVYAFSYESSWPNLSVIVKDSADFLLNELKVLEVPEDPLELEGPNEPTLEALEGANRYLADGQAAYEWSALVPAVVESGVASLAGVEIALAGSHLVVREDGEIVLDRDVPDWIVGPCPHADELTEAWLTAEGGRGLLHIGCAVHVIAWR